MTVAEHYRGLAQRGTALTEALVSDESHLAAQTKSHNFIADFEGMRVAISERPESLLLQAAVTEYQFSLHALAIGNYRHAFISLRLTFELLLATIHFSAYEIKLRKWLINSQDIIWSSLISNENGVYSNSFVSAFFPEMKTLGAQYGALAEKVYRECSEYVHGNYHTHRPADLDREFDAALFSAWHDRADTIRIVFSFAFAARYLALLSPENRTKIEAIMLETLGGLTPVQEIYSTPGSGND